MDDKEKTIKYYIDKVNLLKKENLKLIEYIKNINSYNIKIGNKIFVEHLTSKGIIRTYIGELIKETSSNIVIEVTDKFGKYKYIISKKEINGLKEYYE